MTGEASVIVAGGLESISLIQDGKQVSVQDEWLLAHDMAAELGAMGHIEGAAKRLADRGARGGNYDGVGHL
jgi:hypothetical protein